MNTADKIKKIRKEKKLTQKQLGKLCNMSEAQIGQYENGYRNPKYDTLEKIAIALDVSCRELLEENSDYLLENYSNIEIKKNSIKKREYIMKTGEKIKKYRKDRGITQKELGDILGVTQQMIGKYESCDKTPKLNTLKTIADALGISYLELIDEENNDNHHSTSTELSQLYIDKGELLYLYDGLNEAGKQKAIEYLKLLNLSDELKEIKKED